MTVDRRKEQVSRSASAYPANLFLDRLTARKRVVMKVAHLVLLLLSCSSFSLTGCVGMRSCSVGGAMSCSGGCGEIYVDEYLNHPPVCDPCGSSCDGGCDSCGTASSCGGGCGGSCGGGCGGTDFIGAQGTPCRPILARLSKFWGVKYVPASCGNCGVDGCQSCGGGCDTCGDAGSGYLGNDLFHGGAVSGDYYDDGHVHGSGCNCGAGHAGEVVNGYPMESYSTNMPSVGSGRIISQNTMPTSRSESLFVNEPTASSRPSSSNRTRATTRQPTKSRLVTQPRS